MISYPTAHKAHTAPETQPLQQAATAFSVQVLCFQERAMCPAGCRPGPKTLLTGAEGMGLTSKRSRYAHDAAN
jgi:hypothetical protein